MQKGKRVPSWLVRRRYFKRVGRWLTPKRPGADAPPAPALPSANVLHFPAEGSRRGAAPLRDGGSD